MLTKRTAIIASALCGMAWLNASAQAPAQSEDVMLQGFYWDSQKETGWTQLESQAAELGENFTAIWLPPSAEGEGGNAVGGTNVGYHPRTWNNQNSCWGTSDNLKSLIATLHGKGVKVIADIVINHRAGYTSWVTFAPDDFGEYGKFQLTAAHVCKNDEVNSDTSAGAEYGTATGAADTGENWGGARDLDHTSDYVQKDCIAYMNWLKGEYGYDGWRYDFVKGFGGKYVGIYNDATSPYISVGEYWDGSYDNVAAWIDSTGKKTMAFDFPSKYAAFNNGLAQNNFANMSWIEDNTTWRPAGMIHHANYRRYSITFVDNHDTYRDGSKFTGQVPQAYAYLLSAPGIPCVFYQHWTQYKDIIKSQISARKKAGITSESDVVVTQRSSYYECKATGKNGTLICRIGTAAPTTVPAGYVQVGRGYGWIYYLDQASAGVDAVGADAATEATVTVSGGTVSVSNPNCEAINVYTIDGRLEARSNDIEYTVELPAGVYVVKAGTKATKVLVK